MLVEIDRFRQQLAGQPSVVGADQARHLRALAVRRGAVAGDEVRLRAQRVNPFAIDVAAVVAEEVGGAEERVALQDVAVEVRQRLDVRGIIVRLRHDGQPQAQFAEPHRFRFQIDAVE